MQILLYDSTRSSFISLINVFLCSSPTSLCEKLQLRKSAKTPHRSKINKDFQVLCTMSFSVRIVRTFYCECEQLSCLNKWISEPKYWRLGVLSSDLTGVTKVKAAPVLLFWNIMIILLLFSNISLQPSLLVQRKARAQFWLAYCPCEYDNIGMIRGIVFSCIWSWINIFFFLHFYVWCQQQFEICCGTLHALAVFLDDIAKRKSK